MKREIRLSRFHRPGLVEISALIKGNLVLGWDVNEKRQRRIWLPGRIVIGAAILFLLANLILGLQPGWYYLSGVAIQMLALILLGLALSGLLVVFEGRNIRDVAKSGCLVATAIAVVSFGLFALKIPLRVGFLIGAKSTLEDLVAQVERGSYERFDSDIDSLLYSFSAAHANWRPENGGDSGRLVFTLADDNEAAFIYSPRGIDDFSYNAGNCGHLLGDWYWMKEN